ncbi:MAG: flavodoxin family protein [Clostridia bacterium]|nr:flavodoxin family protein [Clostridia bacterium]
MKVLLVNGSPHERGCTHAALLEVEKALQENGLETEIYQIGKDPIAGCLGCGACRKLGKCVTEDGVAAFIEKAKEADGFIFGSPVYYASPAGSLICLMNRAFYCGGKHLAYKPAAAVVSSRRAGSTTTFDALNKYFTINNMPIVSSDYWNEVHGANGKAEDVAKDEEGLHTMRVLGNNMAWLVKCLALGKKQGIEPKKEDKLRTDFIR